SVEGKENNLTAFSTELFQKIGEKDKISFSQVSVSWDVLMEGLQKGQYVAILHSMTPYNFNQTTYDFSQVYLQTGPVLVTTVKSPFTSLESLERKEVGVIGGSSGVLILEKHPAILIRSYDSAAKMLNDILLENIDAALLDALTASSYCQGLYFGKLKIVTEPFNDAGLRLITLHDRAPELIESFDRGLYALQDSEEYGKLLKKWGFSPD
ncbi:MAG: transporter substrate-binding domain-containing protein, partial [Chlamydiales bacterium]|nr:transporter substrate-binding domain-containing protein [Chlamydiales bacterium]